MTNIRWDRWTNSLIAVTTLLVAVFAVLAIIGYGHVLDLTAPKDDTSWILSQISYEHERLLLAAETDASQATLRLRGDIYLSRVDLLRNAPAFAELRQVASAEMLDKLYKSADATDALIDTAATVNGRLVLLDRLRADSSPIQQEINQLSRLNFGITEKDLAGHANDILHYIMAFGALLLVVIGLSATGVAISRRNMQLQAQRNTADAASRMKSQFLSNMSHEIRTPLNGIIGTLQLIDTDSLTRSNNENIEIIKRSSRSLLGIVNSVLDISKIEAGETPISLKLFDVRVFIAEILSHNAGLINDKEIDLLVRLDDNLPRELYSDRQKLEQILNNLISNALKFTEAGSITLEVRRSAHSGSSEQGMDAVQLIVSDTGIGISDKDQATLFEPFRQVENSLTRRYSGTGLGLNIVRSLVDKLGGTVMLKSALGKGTSITVEVPGALARGSATNEGSGEVAADNEPEVALFGEYSTIFRASLILLQLGKRTRIIATQEEAESFLMSPPDSLRALVADRRFCGDATAWIGQFAAVHGLNVNLPIITVRGVKAFPPSSSSPSVFEIEERFNRSNFLEALQEAAPSLGVRTADTESSRKNHDHGIAEVIERTRVLVVDDNSINRRVLTTLLKNIRVGSIESASSAAEAMTMLEQDRFDLVFMDLQMPDIDGYMATRMIREKGYHDLKIFACSAHAFESDIQRSFDEGLDGHISKPVEQNELLALLRKTIH